MESNKALLSWQLFGCFLAGRLLFSAELMWLIHLWNGELYCSVASSWQMTVEMEREAVTWRQVTAVPQAHHPKSRDHGHTDWTQPSPGPRPGPEHVPPGVSPAVCGFLAGDPARILAAPGCGPDWSERQSSDTLAGAWRKKVLSHSLSYSIWTNDTHALLRPCGMWTSATPCCL